MSNPDPLISNADAAVYVGVSVRTLDTWRCTRRYQIPFIKIGSKVSYRQSELDRWLVSRTVTYTGRAANLVPVPA
jgi:predicted DNA-binding transcriptional regulator AlpA